MSKTEFSPVLLVFDALKRMKNIVLQNVNGGSHQRAIDPGMDSEAAHCKNL